MCANFNFPLAATSAPKSPKYVQRVAGLLSVFEVLRTYPDGISFAELASVTKISEPELRDNLRAFILADPILTEVAQQTPHIPGIEFLDAAGQIVTVSQAEMLRAVTDDLGSELGVSFLRPLEFGKLYFAAQALAEIEPENHDLRAAIDALASLLGAENLRFDPRHATPIVTQLRQARAERRLVQLTYTSDWNSTHKQYAVKPYSLVHTRRGWELDAGLADQPDQFRTFLLDGIETVELLDERFTDPPRLAALLQAERAVRVVQVRIPHGARWAADTYGEAVRRISEDPEFVTLEVDMLQPVDRRLARMMLACGPDAEVISPAYYKEVVPQLAQRLLAHHQQLDSTSGEASVS